MNDRQFNRIIKEHLIGHFDGFVTTGRGQMISVPMNHLWRGFTFASSDYSKERFYVSADIMPLYIPTDFLYTARGIRLRDGNSELWDWDESHVEAMVERLLHRMKSEGIGFLDGFRGPPDVAKTVRAETSNSIEFVAYSLIYSEQFDESLPMLGKLLEVDRGFLRPDSPEYQLEKLQRHEALYQLLRSDPRKAKAQLEDWEKQTIVNLKLGKLPN